MLLAGVSVFSFAPLLYPLAGNTTELGIVRALHGLTCGIFLPAIIALVINLASPGNRGRTIGLFSTAVLMGVSIGPLIGGFILDHYGNDAAFYTCSLIPITGLAMLLANYSALQQNPDRASIASENSWKWLKERVAIGALLTPFLITIGSGAIVFSMTVHVEEFNIVDSDTIAGLIIAAMYTSSMLMRFPAGALSDTVGRKAVILSGFTISAIAIVLIPSIQMLPILVLLGILFGLGMGTAMTPSTALLADVSPSKARGLSMAIGSAILQAGFATGSTAMSAIAEATSYDFMFRACSLSLVAGLLLVFALLYHHH